MPAINRHPERLHPRLPVGVMLWFAGDSLPGVVNAAACAIFGCTEDQLLHDGWLSSVHPLDEPALLTAFAELASRQDRPVVLELRIARGRSVRLTMMPYLDDEGNPTVMGAFVDLTPTRVAEEKLAFMSMHDPMTGLPNRSLFLDHVARLITDYDSHVCILHVDLDQFQLINDAYGGIIGDTLIRHVARRLEYCRPRHGMLARLAGDEFLIVAPGTHVNDAMVLAGNIQSTVSQAIYVDDNRFQITACVGVAAAERGVDADGLLRDASTAMHAAKRHSRARLSANEKAWTDGRPRCKGHAGEHGTTNG
jgi:diguanylate cyclase (GGDEF)-like protein